MPSPRRHLSVDELTQRASTGLAIRRGDVKISEPIPSSYVHNGPEMDHSFENPQATPILAARRSGTDLLQGRNTSSSQPVHVSRFTERTSLGPTLSISNMSSTPSKDSVSQRRNAGLRASIRRMFSSKKDKTASLQKRNQLQSDPGRITPMTTPQLHRVHERSPRQQDIVSSRRPLHSHAPSPHMRVESADALRQQPSLGMLGQRRNTVPDLLLGQPHEQEERCEAQQRAMLSPRRPTTAIKRQTPPSLPSNRRSRSADDLADVLNAPGKPSERRDRTEEIAYWRNSIVVDPVPSLPQPQKTPSPQPEQVEQENDSLSARPRPSTEPVQDFDFGLQNKADATRPSNLMERVNTLEVKLFDFEYALSKLQGTDVVKPNLPKKQPGRRAARDTFPESGSSSANESSSNDHSMLSTPTEDWQSPPLRQHHKPDRASKATTVRPAHKRQLSSRSQLSTPSLIHFTREQYDTLYHLIQDEKVARQRLELQVMDLQKEVDTLKAPVYAYVRPLEYPTPSPESLHEPMRTPRMLHRSPRLRAERDLNETSRFSMTETDDDTEAESPYPEVYETPQENTFRFENIRRRNSPPGMI